MYHCSRDIVFYDFPDEDIQRKILSLSGSKSLSTNNGFVKSHRRTQEKLNLLNSVTTLEQSFCCVTLSICGIRIYTNVWWIRICLYWFTWVHIYILKLIAYMQLSIGLLNNLPALLNSIYQMIVMVMHSIKLNKSKCWEKIEKSKHFRYITHFSRGSSCVKNLDVYQRKKREHASIKYDIPINQRPWQLWQQCNELNFIRMTNNTRWKWLRKDPVQHSPHDV